MFLFKSTAALCFLLFAASASAVELDELTAQCEGCHGPKGVSTDSDVPTIAGQTAGFLQRTLNTFQVWGRPCIKSAYRHGDTSRPETDMCQVAEGLTGEEIRALADYYSQQTFVPADQPWDESKAAAGKLLQEQHCETCHEQGGTAAETAPRLAGQWTPYLRKALQFVPTGEHLVPPLMERTVTDFSKDQIDALLNYYASRQDK
ncbi:MAG: c-type cytochrome [Lysobacterales bacterium]